MTISIWRYSHLALAVSSFLFLLLASVTGIVLAFEPVSQKAQPYHVEGFNEITVATALPVLKSNFEEILDISVDANQFVIVKAIDNDGKNVSVYANAKTGKKIGVAEKQNEFFQWVTTLHRSLFLHETGRFFMGVTAFLLFLIALSGTILIVKRQRGIKRFFTKIVKENFAQYYHVILGRLSLIPILIIAVTGVFLTLGEFEIITEQKISHKIDFDAIKSEPKLELADFKVFKSISLSEVQQIEFPFSDDPEDYFTLKLTDREITVNQFTGDILTEVPHSTSTLLTALSLDLHTGRTSAIWAIILAIASANILFFIYSGFAMTLKRRGNRIRNTFSKDQANIIILVGSENGSTFKFANSIHKQLLKLGQKSFLAELNSYSVYPNADHLIVLTATYGLGEEPTNASKFTDLIHKIKQEKAIRFSVVGFGSESYPDFCQFAFEVNNLLSGTDWGLPLTEIQTVNDKSPVEFSQWAEIWAQKSELPIVISPEMFDLKPKKVFELKVVEKTIASTTDGAFLIRLRPVKKVKFTSGDLLSIYPANDHRERQYSIGKIDADIQLSVRLHENGLGSGYLNELESGAVIKAHITKNPHFHFPKSAPTVIMISNGTGIAPFLGMIDQNLKNTNCYLYCGFRGQASFNLYEDAIRTSLKSNKLTQLQVSYSREGDRHYVKDLLPKDASFIAATLQDNGVIMICGSLSMQQNVIEVLETICSKNGNTLSFYQSRNQVLMDCY